MDVKQTNLSSIRLSYKLLFKLLIICTFNFCNYVTLFSWLVLETCQSFQLCHRMVKIQEFLEKKKETLKKYDNHLLTNTPLTTLD